MHFKSGSGLFAYSGSGLSQISMQNVSIRARHLAIQIWLQQGILKLKIPLLQYQNTNRDTASSTILEKNVEFRNFISSGRNSKFIILKSYTKQISRKLVHFYLKKKNLQNFIIIHRYVTEECIFHKTLYNITVIKDVANQIKLTSGCRVIKIAGIKTIFR